MGEWATRPTFRASPPEAPPSFVSAEFEAATGTLLLEFSEPALALGSLVPGEWLVNDLAGNEWTFPSSWSIVGGGTVQVSGFTSGIGSEFASTFSKAAGSLISFASGPISAIPLSPYTPI